MALTARYCRPGLSTGANNGTSESNAWRTLTDMASGYAAGQVIYVQDSGSFWDEGSTVTLTTAGTGANPVRIEGYKTTPGDGGDSGHSNNFRLASQLVVAQGVTICFINYEGSPGTATDYPITCSPLGMWSAYRCRAKNNRTDSTVPLFNLDDEGSLIGCTLVPGQGQRAAQTLDSGKLLRCRVDMRASGAKGVEISTSWQQYSYVVENQFLGAGSNSAIFGDSYSDNQRNLRFIYKNSIYNVGIGIDLPGVSPSTSDGNTVIYGNIIYTCSTGIRNQNANEAGVVVIYNAIGNASVARYSGFGNNPTNIGDVTLTSNPFSDPDNFDFTINDTAGGGAAVYQNLLADLILDGSNINKEHYGSIQTQVAGGGGGNGGGASKSSLTHGIGYGYPL